MYAAQVTPVITHPPIIVPSSVQSVFEIGQVVGTGDYSLDGILCTPPFPGEKNIQTLGKFDAEHANYAVITKHVAISTINCRAGEIFMLLLNARAFLITDNSNAAYQLSVHTAQYLRNTGIALEVTSSLDTPSEPIYSPTKLRVVADEFSGKGVVLMQGSWQPFEKLES